MCLFKKESVFLRRKMKNISNYNYPPPPPPILSWPIKPQTKCSILFCAEVLTLFWNFPEGLFVKMQISESVALHIWRNCPPPTTHPGEMSEWDSSRTMCGSVPVSEWTCGRETGRTQRSQDEEEELTRSLCLKTSSVTKLPTQESRGFR